jgi:hypothetical protein
VTHEELMMLNASNTTAAAGVQDRSPDHDVSDVLIAALRESSGRPSPSGQRQEEYIHKEAWQSVLDAMLKRSA